MNAVKPIPRRWWPWLALSALAGACLVVGVIGVGILGWALSRSAETGSPAQEVLLGGEEWTWADLQTHLAKHGMPTRRAMGRRGMWFEPGPGEPIEFGMTDCYDTSADFAFEDRQCFVVTKQISPAAARQRVQYLVDERQRHALAWRSFVFEGSPAKLAELRQALGK